MTFPPPWAGSEGSTPGSPPADRMPRPIAGAWRGAPKRRTPAGQAGRARRFPAAADASVDHAPRRSHRPNRAARRSDSAPHPHRAGVGPRRLHDPPNDRLGNVRSPCRPRRSPGAHVPCQNRENGNGRLPRPARQTPGTPRPRRVGSRAVRALGQARAPSPAPSRTGEARRCPAAPRRPSPTGAESEDHRAHGDDRSCRPARAGEVREVRCYTSRRRPAGSTRPVAP